MRNGGNFCFMFVVDKSSTPIYIKTLYTLSTTLLVVLYNIQNRDDEHTSNASEQGRYSLYVNGN